MSQLKTNSDSVFKRIFWTVLVLVFIVYFLFNTIRLLRHPADAYVVDYR